MKATYYGHSCFAVKVMNRTLLFDPFIRGNELAKGVNVNAIPADYIFVSHGHVDHIADTIEIATRTSATVVSSFEVIEFLRKARLPKTHAMNHGGAWKFDFGRAKFVAAIHSSSLPDGSYGGHPGGFVIESAEGNFYYSGDTALTMDMKLIGETTRLTFAALCIGDNFTMGIDDAIKAADFVGCNEVLGLHYDTFPPIQIDRKVALQKFKAAGKTLHLLNIGASRDF
jgi:L-ascorbate metabolism protein UlaG (beta-lactamase superfamily)